jgi:lipoprotein-releasing system permease protein
MADYAQVERDVASNQHVRAVSPFIFGPVLVETQGDTNRPALQDAPMLRGIDPQSGEKINDISHKIRLGTFDLSGRGLIVGSDFADNMQLQVGDHLSIFSAREIKKFREALKNKQDYSFLPDDYEIRGIFDTGYYEYNSRVIITSLENAQDLFDLDDSVHGLFVTLDDPYQVTVVKMQLRQSLGENFSVMTWMEQNSAILGALVVEKHLMFYIMFFIVIVAAFGITCTLITFVIMKTPEIGLMKAVGASNRQVMSIFVFQSIIVSVFGVLCGVSLGLLAVAYRNSFLHLMDRLMGFELFPSSIYGFGALPAVIIPRDIIVICGGSLLICLFAAVLPARHASKMNTVKALHHE